MFRIMFTNDEDGGHEVRMLLTTVPVSSLQARRCKQKPKINVVENSFFQRDKDGTASAAAHSG